MKSSVVDELAYNVSKIHSTFWSQVNCTFNEVRKRNILNPPQNSSEALGQ